MIMIEDAMKGEFHENTMRKDFAISEVAEIIDAVKETRVGHRQSDDEKDGNLPSYQPGLTRDIVSKMTGFSTRQIDKISTISQKAKTNKKFQKYMEDIDNKKKSVNTVHTLVTKETRNLPKVELPKDQYDVIYCDVPIGFKDSGNRAAAEKHYPTIDCTRNHQGF